MGRVPAAPRDCPPVPPPVTALQVLKILLHLCAHGSASSLLILKRNPAFIQEAAGTAGRGLGSQGPPLPPHSSSLLASTPHPSCHLLRPAPSPSGHHGCTCSTGQSGLFLPACPATPWRPRAVLPVLGPGTPQGISTASRCHGLGLLPRAWHGEHRELLLQEVCGRPSGRWGSGLSGSKCLSHPHPRSGRGLSPGLLLNQDLGGCGLRPSPPLRQELWVVLGTQTPAHGLNESRRVVPTEQSRRGSTGEGD